MIRETAARNCVLLAFLALNVAPAAHAQTTGDIRGSVLDPGGTPLPGATVEVRSPALQGARRTSSDASGGFRFPAVPPGPYVLTATLKGFSTFEVLDIVVRLSETVLVNVVLRISQTESVVVTGEAPIVDVVSTTTGTNLTSDLVEKLPVGRNYADVMRLQPGVQEDVGATQGRSLALSIYGSTSAENLFLIDGVNTTNVLLGIQGKAINPEFVQETEVKTGGYQAEYGRNTGGVVNVITKQGGNEFHGSAFGYFDDASTQAERKLELTPDFSGSGDPQISNTYPKNTRWDAGATLGGYFVRDLLWFFGAYDRVEVDRTTQPTSGVNAGLQIPQGFTTNLYSGKLTFRATRSTDISASIFADPQFNDGSWTDFPLGADPRSWLHEREIGGMDGAVRLNQLLGATGLAAAQYGHHEDRFRMTVADVPFVRDFTGTFTNGSPPVDLGGVGGVGTISNNESSRDIAGGSLSLFLGAHEVKLGGDWQKESTSGTSYLSGGQRVYIFPCLDRANYRCDLSKAPVVEAAGGLMPVFYRHAYWVPNATDLTPIRGAIPFESPGRSWSVFLQDSWKVLPNLTVNAGLRYDDQRVYWGNGELAMDLKSQWSPRLGVAWDFLRDGSSKLFGSFGRFYYSLPSMLSASASRGYGGVSNTYNYSATDLEQEPAAPRDSFVQAGSAYGEPVDAGIRASYQDELTFGVEKAFGPTFSAGAKFTHRRLGRAIEDRCDLDPTDPLAQNSTCALFNPGGSGPAASGGIGTCNASENPTDPTAGECFKPGVAVPAAQRTFMGFELMARKRIGSSFWAQASYLYSSLKGNYSGAVSTNFGTTYPGVNPDFDYYQMLENAYGRLEMDRPHQARLDGTYTFPFGLTASLGFYVRSGVTITLTNYLNAGYPWNLFPEERGSYGRGPADWDANLALGWDIRVGSVMITPQVYLFRVFNQQAPTYINADFNPNGSFVDDPASPYYGKAGITPGAPGCTGSSVPCTDNPDFGKTLSRTSPRQLRVAVRVAF